MSQASVRILATCRSERLLPFTLLVFRTLRIGFPSADVLVTGNALPTYAIARVAEACAATGCGFENRPETIHHRYIEQLVASESGPFILSDTDVIFYDKVEDWKFTTLLAGYRVPDWESKCGHITRSRLHPSLMFIDPIRVRGFADHFTEEKPLTPFMPPANLFYPILIPINGRLHFFDTMSLCYHLFGGTAFTDVQKDAYFHFHAGTISDLTLPFLDNPEAIQKEREWIMEDPQRGRGHWRAYEQYFENHVPKYDGGDVVAPIAPEDSVAARQWNVELCYGNLQAMEFTDLWYGLVHAWDDLVDTVIDGRPTMSRDQMVLEIGLRSAMLYNHPFYVANREILFPVILHITSTWRVSVGWERSPLAHRRVIADACRTCGNHLYYFIALLTGGEQHAQQMILKIHEIDFLKQHDAQGRPI